MSARKPSASAQGEPPPDSTAPRLNETLQTLSRGIQILEVLSDRQEGLSVTQFANILGVHRTIVTRLLTTLQAHRLVVRDQSSRYWLGPELSRYALSVAPRMRDAALPELRRLAREHPVTAMLTIADVDEAVIVAVAEPATADFFVGIRVGTRHSLHSVAGGVALLAGRPETSDETDEVKVARRRGYALSRGTVNQGALGLAAPIGRGPEWLEGSIAVVTLAELDPSVLGPEVAAAAHRVNEALGSQGQTPARP